MRIAVCDDEDRELCRLSDLLTQYQACSGVEIDLRIFRSGTDLLCATRGGEYDLILLDVLMPGLTGLQTAHELRELDKTVKLIFLTASPEFAMESYSVGAYQYLLKPATEKVLFPLLDQICTELTLQVEQGLVLKAREGVVRVNFSQLEYVEVMNKTVSFHLIDGVVREITAALADFEGELLARPEFLKIHRSYLVNLSFVQGISAKGAATRSGHTIPVSRSQYNQIKDAYLRFLFRAETVSVPDKPPVEKPEVKWERCPGPWQLLLVDDESPDLTAWAGVLRSHGCVVRTAGDGPSALRLAAESPFDCVLLDVRMPGEDGFSLCKQLRDLTRAPVIFLSCLTDVDSQTRGFAEGGVDYITKDTPPELFWAKVETRIRLSVSDRTQLRFGPLLLDLKSGAALVEGVSLSLSPIEFDLLLRLSSHPGRTHTPEELFALVWGDQPWDGGQLVQLHMSRLRRKLEKAWAKHYFIEAVWGQGYRFVPVNES